MAEKCADNKGPLSKLFFLYHTESYNYFSYSKLLHIHLNASLALNVQKFSIKHVQWAHHLHFPGWKLYNIDVGIWIL